MKWHTYAVVITAMTDMASRALVRSGSGSSRGVSAAIFPNTPAPAVSPAPPSPAVSPNSFTTCAANLKSRTATKFAAHATDTNDAPASAFRLRIRHSGAHTSTTTYAIDAGRVQYHAVSYATRVEWRSPPPPSFPPFPFPTAHPSSAREMNVSDDSPHPIAPSSGTAGARRYAAVEEGPAPAVSPAVFRQLCTAATGTRHDPPARANAHGSSAAGAASSSSSSEGGAAGGSGGG
mmetsp:Transcript_10771/g.44814  ORF Transcript_10771/g.44814 Transcript_10771/m.44814 type:complete len:234 (-) Transcript_10771:589-1290(-)